MTTFDASSLLELRGVTKSYSRGDQTVTAVQHVSFSVAEGEFVFLCGPSGSGKSTLLTMIGCLLKPDRGSIFIESVDTTLISERQLTDLRRFKIGFVFQRFNLIQGLSAVQNVALPLMLRTKNNSRQAHLRAKYLLNEVGLGEQINVDPRTMSVGQCQRVAVARALVTQPRIVLADEPTASLDSENGSKSIELLKRVTLEYGAACLVVTHDTRILPFADRVIRLDDGRIVADLTSDSTKDSQPTLPLRQLEPVGSDSSWEAQV